MIGFIGGGNMAEALIKGIANNQKSGVKSEILVSEPLEVRRGYLQSTYGIAVTQSNREVASRCDIIILSVKPQIMDAVLNDIADTVSEEKTVVSIAAGITLSYLGARLRTKRLIRVMPNTPALVQEGMSVLSLCECFSDRDIGTVREIFMSIGRVLTLPEKQMNAVTAVSGSGPAFIALFVKAMIDSGEKLGLGRKDAAELSVQTLLGTAKLLDTGMSPEQLMKMVTSPGGTTAAGLEVFKDKDLEGTVSAALSTACDRAEELGRGVK